MAFLEIKNIHKQFNGKSTLKNIDISLNKGDFISLLGKSGCGKTTLLRIIAGLEKPDSGHIFLNGLDITNLPVQSRNIGFVFQNYALFPHLNVFQNVAYGLKIKKLNAASIKDKVEHTLKKIGLFSKKDTNVSSLSGGEQQRVAFARAIVTEPEIILLDEPLSNLDFSLRIQARNELKRLQNELGITTIYVTHDQSEALALSDYISLMDDGHIIQSGSPKEIYHSPSNRFSAEFVGRYNFFNPTQAFEFFNQKISDTSYLIVLPENLSIKKTDEQTEAWIKDISFTGTLTEYAIEHNGALFKSIVITKVSDMLRTGDRVKLIASTDDIKIISP